MAAFLGLTLLALLLAARTTLPVDPFLVLLAFAASRLRLSRLPLPALVLVLARGLLTLTPTWLSLFLGGLAVGTVLLLRRFLVAARPGMQLLMTAFVAGVMVGGEAVALAQVYPHRPWPEAVAAALPTVAWSAAAAPLVHLVLVRTLLRGTRALRPEV